MIHYQKGNIVNSDADALVNTVNTVGVMGKGIALSYKKAFPDMYKQYKAACENGEVTIGRMHVYETGRLIPRLIINFPTKKHWRHPSKYNYIVEGLKALAKTIEDYKIKSIAIPPLGCGNGGLDWKNVKALILEELDSLQDHTDLIIFEPGYKSALPQQKGSADLTPARAMLYSIMESYQSLGQTLTAITVQKLAYFLQRQGEELSLRYSKGFYGPYADNLPKVINVMSPHYLTVMGDLSKPYTKVSLDNSKSKKVKQYVSKELNSSQKENLNKVLNLIEGFENTLGLELLATVDYALEKCPECSLEEIVEQIHNWTKRKRELMPDYHIQVAYKRLKDVD